VFVSDKFICVNDGVGAWAQEEKGHAALFSRLMAHFWAKQVEDNSYSSGGDAEPDPMICLQRAYEHTNAATAQSGWVGTTTASGALLSWERKTVIPQPVLYITQLGDSQIMVLCPRDRAIIYKTREQWHWFDCPRQLGTNSPDMPESNAVVDLVRVQEDDVVLAMSDGVVDNLWDHEVLQIVLDSMDRWKKGEAVSDSLPAANSELREQSYPDEMMYVAAELVKAAKAVAQDPFAESPYMEKACDEGLSIEGGKMDDISVVAAIIKRRRI
jgi:serine/threonine protein phosphatase PrpC